MQFLVTHQAIQRECEADSDSEDIDEDDDGVCSDADWPEEMECPVNENNERGNDSDNEENLFALHGADEEAFREYFREICQHTTMMIEENATKEWQSPEELDAMTDDDE